MLLTKLPIPLPFVVCASAMVGLGVVLQHTPRAVILAPPSLSIIPPLIASFPIIEFTAVVVIPRGLLTQEGTPAIN